MLIVNDATGRMGMMMSDDEAVLQILNHQPAVFRFLLSMVGDYSDAEDLLQQSMLTVWQKRSETENGIELPWVLTIAKNHALNHRRKLARHAQSTGFTDDALDRIACCQLQETKKQDRRSSALEECMQQLSVDNRSLINSHYSGQWSIDQVAEKCGKSVQATYKLLQRLRKRLFDCVNSKTAAGVQP